MIEVIDNFLSDSEFAKIQEQFLFNSNIRWQFNPYRDYPIDKLIHDEKNEFQFVHGLYRDFCIFSEYFDDIRPILSKLNVSALIRAKVNLNPRSENIIEGNFHIDNNSSHKVAIFCLNTNNGYTLFESGEKVKSIENRMILFDGSIRHTGTNCTDKQRRVVININYL